MAQYTEKQLRNIGEAALAGDVPSKNDPESEDRKASNSFIEAQQAKQQAEFKAAESPPVIYPAGFRHPSWGGRQWVQL
jgi:hypothetical protein